MERNEMKSLPGLKDAGSRSEEPQGRFTKGEKITLFLNNVRYELQ